MFIKNLGFNTKLNDLIIFLQIQEKKRDTWLFSRNIIKQKKKKINTVPYLKNGVS